MTAAEKVHYWILKYKMANGVLPDPSEILSQIEMAIEEESTTDVINRRALLLSYSEWWDKKYSPRRNYFHRQKDVDNFLGQ